MRAMMNRTIQPPIRPLEHFEMIRPEQRILRNGITLNVIEAGTEDVVRIDFVIAGGRIDQEYPLQSLLTNRMLREGTAHLSSTEISEKLDFYGAWLNLVSGVNSCLVTLYSLNKYVEQTLAVVADMLKAPSFPQSELDRVAASSLQQFRVNQDRVEVMATKAFNRAVFGPDHVMSRYAQEADYGRITPDLLRSYYRTHYSSANCTLYASGHVTPEIIRCIEAHLGDEPWGEAPSKPVKRTLDAAHPAEERRLVVPCSPRPQSSVRMGGLMMDRLHPDYMKAKVMVTLLGGYFGSRLMKNIREDKGYTYGVSANLQAYDGATQLIIGMETGNDYVEPAIREVYHEMDRLQQERVGEEELDMARNYLMGDMCRSCEGPFSLSDAWIYIHNLGLGDDYFPQLVEAVRSCQPEEVQRLAQTYLRTENMKEIIAGHIISQP
jgi:predicted Zn-dependent peptidase